MGKKMMKLPSIFKNKEETTRSSTTTTVSSSWQWPSCKQPKTHSFRAGDDIFKTVNSVYFDAGGELVNTPESWFTNSSESGSFSTVSEESGEESLEMVIRGLRSERLFFEPGHTNSILEEAKAGGFRFKESVVMAMDSEDPYVDFRNSMEEMVEAHGLKDWECLEELLSWYLRVNGKKNHGYIVGAFVDLLVSLAAAAAAENSSSSSSPSSPSLYSILQDPEEDIEKVSSCLEISEI
ncbi:Ovate protein family [Macleaya cordata]|uniref:Transcription repressor n=1 Tax=Macleaya cordata TaxID=56857 RepID=A0A200Q9N5_MACCD|nr:Ovate protein family [Macleaya cordata]